MNSLPLLRLVLGVWALSHSRAAADSDAPVAQTRDCAAVERKAGTRLSTLLVADQLLPVVVSATGDGDGRRGQLLAAASHHLSSSDSMRASGTAVPREDSPAAAKGTLTTNRMEWEAVADQRFANATTKSDSPHHDVVVSALNRDSEGWKAGVERATSARDLPQDLDARTAVEQTGDAATEIMDVGTRAADDELRTSNFILGAWVPRPSTAVPAAFFLCRSSSCPPDPWPPEVLQGVKVDGAETAVVESTQVGEMHSCSTAPHAIPLYTRARSSANPTR